MRFQRSIQLRPDTPKIPVADTIQEYDFLETTESVNGGFCHIHRWRTGDILHCETRRSRTCETAYGDLTKATVTTWSRSCFIDYNEIYAACRIESDEHNAAPWEDCDGFEHDVVSEDPWENDFEQRTMYRYHGADYSPDMFTKQRGYFFDRYGSDRGLIVIDDRYKNGDSIYAHARQQGASKQVAAELLAQWKQQYINQIVVWRTEGWSYVGVVCEFNTGTDEYEESSWGIDDETYAAKYVKHDIATQVVWALEEDGYVVLNKPDAHADYKEHRRAEYRRRINQFNWR